MIDRKYFEYAVPLAEKRAYDTGKAYVVYHFIIATASGPQHVTEVREVDASIDDLKRFNPEIAYHSTDGYVGG